MWSNYIIKRLLSGVSYAFYANVMLRLWRPRVTNCAIVSPRFQLHAVLTVAATGGKFFIPSMIAGTLAAIGCCFHVIAFFYAGRSLDNDLELLTTPTRATAAIKKHFRDGWVRQITNLLGLLLPIAYRN